MKSNQINNFSAIVEKCSAFIQKQGWTLNTNRHIEFMVKQWKDNKKTIRKLLRNHPDWDEETQSIQWRANFFNAILCKEMAKNFISEMDKYAESLCVENLFDSYQKRYCFENFVRGMSQVVCKNDADWLSNNGLSCSEGQKSSRFINQVCENYGINNMPNYNKLFAKLSDVLNAKLVERTCVLSINPLAYLGMSYGNSWSSCHNILKSDGNTYANGVWSYMQDKTSMVMFVVKNEDAPRSHDVKKIMRQMFHYKSGMLWQSRLYPSADHITSVDTIRKGVQGIMSTCLSSTDGLCSECNSSSWIENYDFNTIRRYIKGAKFATHYPDYDNECTPHSLSTLKELKTYRPGRLVVGEKCVCPKCGNLSHFDEGFSCCDRETCYMCDAEIDVENEEYFTDYRGGILCMECVHFCDACEEAISELDMHYLDDECLCPQCYGDLA